METPNPQPITPVPDHNNFPPPVKSTSKKTKNLQFSLIGLGVVAAILLILVIIFAVSASNANSQLTTAKADAQKAGAEAQKAADEKRFAETQSSDVRTYTAPATAGSFSLQIPKLWSLSTTQNDGINTLSAIANPSEIDTKADRYALRFSLKDQPYAQAKTALDQQTKQKTSSSFKGLSASATTLSGIEGTKYVGQIGSKIPNGTVILVPIRDKTFSIQTDDNDVYSAVFNTILASVKLNP